MGPKDLRNRCRLGQEPPLQKGALLGIYYLGMSRLAHRRYSQTYWQGAAAMRPLATSTVANQPGIQHTLPTKWICGWFGCVLNVFQADKLIIYACRTSVGESYHTTFYTKFGAMNSINARQKCLIGLLSILTVRKRKRKRTRRYYVD